ncbi:amyloid fiber anchoring/assembly protein TapA [Aquibacillus rhizosphaerae]|uniref:Amyloid fiber anchoring/assembly protein TapA n=1 Tax=Aquibacillus rhizosphaerae TaxID=3051431 RepID=A0ABT7KZJ9_9BACI|nr:amyloid fiber anchoring/assembly protein TapA [Aquibacillus sp. LR5S19]MDL4838938.1 amyloid fiber anchoring/assembly protein TapA [Aquibacillus sp. LR5S19]
MRSSRLMRYRKKYKNLIIVAQIVAIWYITLVSAAVLTSSTGAYFNETNKVGTTVQVGTWWDGSDLEFTGIPTQNVKSCPQTEISVELKNNGFTMIDSTDYEIYYVENGNPKQNGVKIAEGSLVLIKAGEVTSLTYDADKEGSYMFKAYQVPGYNDDYESRQEIWSEKVMVKCLKVETKEKEKKQPEKPAEIKESVTTPEPKETKEDSVPDKKEDSVVEPEKTPEQNNEEPENKQDEPKIEETQKENVEQPDLTDNQTKEEEVQKKAVETPLNEDSNETGDGEGQ